MIRNREKLNRRIFVKINAYIMIGLAFIFVIVGLLGSVAPWIFLPDADATKKIIVSAIAILFGFFLFFICIGRHQFLIEFLEVEDDVEELKEKGIEGKIVAKDLDNERSK